MSSAPVRPGLAAAQQLTRAGHDVVVYERADRIGGLLRYGIPEFKMEKRHLDRRLEQMEAEGTVSGQGVTVGVDVTADELRATHDAVVLACGATQARDLPIPGRELDGIHQAMDYLPIANKVQEGDFDAPSITAEGLDVVIIGGGDTGADCLGTAHRQGAASIHQFEIMPRPPDERAAGNPWADLPDDLPVSSAHEEGGEREYAINTVEFEGDGEGRVTNLRTVRVEQVFEDGRMSFEPSRAAKRTSRLSSSCSRWLHRARAGPTGRAVRGRAHRPGQRRPRRRLGPPTSTACSSAATWGEVRASSSGPSPRPCRRGVGRPPPDAGVDSAGPGHPHRRSHALTERALLGPCAQVGPPAADETVG